MQRREFASITLYINHDLTPPVKLHLFFKCSQPPNIAQSFQEEYKIFFEYPDINFGLT